MTERAAPRGEQRAEADQPKIPSWRNAKFSAYVRCRLPTRQHTSATSRLSLNVIIVFILSMRRSRGRSRKPASVTQRSRPGQMANCCLATSERRDLFGRGTLAPRTNKPLHGTYTYQHTHTHTHTHLHTGRLLLLIILFPIARRLVAPDIQPVGRIEPQLRLHRVTQQQVFAWNIIEHERTRE